MVKTSVQLWLDLQRSNVQVQACLSALHQAIDRAVALDDQRAGRDTGGGTGSGADSKETQQGLDRAVEAWPRPPRRRTLHMSRVAPAPAAADLMYEPSP